MLIDDVHIFVKAGDGGNGASTLKRNGLTAKGGPDGGDGGNGGDISVVGVSDLSVLSQFQFKKKWVAENGIQGKKNNLYGKNADPLVIKVPVGSEITDADGHVVEISDTKTERLIARGGKGGRGNNQFKSASIQTPTYAEKGFPGEEKELHIVLKLIADIGLIGLPNAGKSSLLAALTNATPKIGNYPFTTLEPNLGILDHLILADIPGLIEGASEGKGLGIKFLKHIEKTKLLVHCIDSTLEDPVSVYNTVRKEFSDYGRGLNDKKEIILLTKTDLIDTEKLEEQTQKLKQFSENIYSVSVIDDGSLEKIKDLFRSI